MVENLEVGKISDKNNFLIYCETCNKVLFQGDDRNPIDNMILYSCSINHIDGFTEAHVISVMYPEKNGGVATNFLDLMVLKQTQTEASLYDLFRNGQLRLPPQEQ